MTEVTMDLRQTVLSAADELGVCVIRHVLTSKGGHNGSKPSSGMHGAVTLSSGRQMRMMTAVG